MLQHQDVIEAAVPHLSSCLLYTSVREYLDNRQKYIEQGRAIESNAAQQAAREKAFVDKVDELQDAGCLLYTSTSERDKLSALTQRSFLVCAFVILLP